VPEATAFGVDLPASRRAGRLRAAARVLTLVAAGACGTAALLAPSPMRVAAALASIGAFVLASWPASRAAARRLAVDADGTIRTGIAAADEPAVVRYCGRHLVCLGTPGGLVAVWPDSMSAANWRRLLVACRWRRRTPGDGGQAASELRTK
jgi:hypothetical protein